MTSHYHLLAAIHLVSLLIFKVSPSPTPFVPNANLDLKSTHHAVTQNPDCDKPVGNPFDILPSFSMGLTGNENQNAESKSLAIFGDENTQVESEMKDTYDIGAYSAVCWSRIVTTVQDPNGRVINNLTEYAVSFETPGDIPDKYLAEYSIEAHNNKYVKKSVQVPITNVRRSGDNTVTEKRYITCSSGPLYSRTLVKYKNNKKKLEIRVSPKKQSITESHKEGNKSFLDEICEDISNGEDDEKTTAIKEELLWQIIKDILGGHNVTQNTSYTNLTELINNKREELIEKIEEIMPDNVNKTDSILDETIQKIKQDELQSSTSASKTGVSSIYTSQWGMSSNSGYSTVTKEMGGSLVNKQNGTSNSEHTTQVYVSVDLSNNEMELESSALVKDPPTSAGYDTTQSYSTFPQQTEQKTFTIRVTEFVSYRRGVILDEIMRHMNTYCYDVSKYVLEIECPAQLDAVPTINSTRIPRFASFKYVHLISDSMKRNNFFVTDPKQQTCYILVKSKKVECPADTSKLLNLRIVTYAGNQQINSTTENPTSMNTNGNNPMVVSDTTTTLASQTENIADEFKTFTIRVTEFVSYRRGVILDEIMRHMNTYCYDVSRNILEIQCPAELDTVPTINKTKIPSFVSYTKVHRLPEPKDQNNFIVTDPVQKACYVLVKVKEVQCPEDTSKLLNLRIVTYAGNQQISTTTMTTTENPTSMYTNWYTPSVGYETGSTLATSQTENTEADEFETFTIRVTEFVSYRRGVILDEIMRHMNTYCYDVSKNILETECPAQMDTVPTIDNTKLPSFVSYPTVRHIPELVKRNNFVVTDPVQKACYILVKVKKVQCPSDTSKLLNIRIVTYAEKPQISTTSTVTTTETTLTPQTGNTEGDEFETFTIRVTEFVSYRRGVILDEIMRHMKTYCYDVSKNILEIECPAQLDTTPTINKTRIPASASYKYVKHIPESVKLNNFVVTDPKQQTCYVLVKVKEVQCPADTSKLLNLRIVTYAGNQEISTTTMTSTENPTSMNTNSNKPNVGYETSSTLAATQTVTTNWNKPISTTTLTSTDTTLTPQTQNTEADELETFTIRVTEFVSYRRGVILDEIMRHMNTYCYDVSKNILEIECPAQLDAVPTIDKTKIPSFALYKYVKYIPESVKLNNFIVTDPKQQTCYVLVKVKEVQCPEDTSKLLNIRIVTYAGNQEAVSTTSTSATTMTSTTIQPPMETFIVRITEFLSRRGVVLEGILRHMQVYCYEVLKTIFQVPCVNYPEYIAEMDTATLPYYVETILSQYTPDLTDNKNVFVRSTRQNVCYVLTFVRKVSCPAYSKNVVNIRVVDMSKFINRITMNIGHSVQGSISHDISYGQTGTHLNMNEIHSHTTSQNNTSSTLQHAVEGGIMQQNYSSTAHSKTDKNTEKTNTENAMKMELINEIIQDLIIKSMPGFTNKEDDVNQIKKELLLEIVEDLVKEKENQEPKWYFTKFVDQNNITYCFKQNAENILPEACPENTANLEFVSLTEDKYFLARYIDMQNRVHCVYVYNNLLKPTPCKSDTMNLPIVSPSNDRPLLMKYIDNERKVHCYLQYINRLEHTTCPEDNSYLPETSMHQQIYTAQYVDYQKHRFCYEVHNDFIKKVPCPSHQLPSLHLTYEQTFIGKIVISKDIEFCYNVYEDRWKPTRCPANTDDVPIIFSSSSSLYMGKITDNKNQDFCYFVDKNSLSPVPCPLDTSNLPVVTPSNGKSYVGKILDAKNREFCFTVYEDHVKPIACQKDTSTLPFISFTSEQSYIGKMQSAENGMQCFVVSKNTMKVVSCPDELSTIPYVTPTDDVGYMAKYVDLLGQLKCFMVYNNTVQNTICPVDTSNLPLAPMQDIVNHLNQIEKNSTEKNIEENVIKTELLNEIMEDLISINSTPATTKELEEVNQIKKELLLEIVDDLVKEKQNEEPKWHFTKYVDQNNITYCFKQNDDTILPEACPENTANLEFVSLTEEKYFLARYIDMQNRVHCVYVYNNLLKPTPCKSDAMNLPLVSPSNNRPLLVKFIDVEKKVHCYLQYVNRLEHTTCPEDNSHLPETSMHQQVYIAQYLDYQKHRFCYEVHADFIKKVACPSHQLPSLHLSNEHTFVGKIEISKDIEFCYNVYKDHWKPVNCPANTLHLPIIFSSSSNLFIGKITDNRNQDFCYFVNENSFSPVPCPLDTSNLPVVTPSNGKSYVGKILDAKNKEYCFMVYQDSMKPTACQEDTSTLPYISPISEQSYIGKMETVENGVQCFVVSKNTMKVVSCPGEMSNIPYVTPTDQTGYLAKYVNLLGELKCFMVYSNTVQNTVCPADTSNLPLAPMPNKVDGTDQKEKSDTEKNIEENVIKTELLNEIMEDLISNKSTPVNTKELEEVNQIKKELLLEIVEDLVKEKQNEEPKGHFTKYVDQNNITYCYIENEGLILPQPCPEDTTNLEFVSLTEEKQFLARYIDTQNKVHCVYVYNNLLKPTPCKSDAMNLPIVSPTNNRPLLMKFIDAQNKVHCYLQYVNRLEHTACPEDNSYLPETSMHQQVYIAQYVDYQKHRFCYEVHNDFIKKVPCPSHQLPSLHLTYEQSFVGKIVISKDVEFCYNVYEDRWKPTRCPTNTDDVPIIFSSSSSLYMGKIRDNKNQDFCYFVNENSLSPVPCPLDTSYLPVVTPSNSKSYVGKILDAKNREFCFTVYEDSMKPTACQKDTSTLPLISLTSKLWYIGKMETVENGVQCFVVSNTAMKSVFCPKELSTLPYVTPTDNVGYLAKYVDLLGQTKCFIVYKNAMKNAICPADTVILPLAPTSINLWWYGKYVTAQNEIVCLKIQGETKIRVPCSSNAYMLPTVENVDDVQVMPPNSVTLHQKEIRELIKVMCKDKFYTHFQKNNNNVALQKIRRFLP